MVWDLCIVSVSSLEWGQRKEMWIQPEAARKQFDEFWHAILVWPFCPHNPSCFKIHLAGCWCHTSMTSQIGSESKAHSSLQSGPIIHAGEFFLHLIWWVHVIHTYACSCNMHGERILLSCFVHSCWPDRYCLLQPTSLPEKSIHAIHPIRNQLPE